MNRYCAWCKKELISTEPNGRDNTVTHGICKVCATLLEYQEISPDEIISRFDGPIAIIDKDENIIAMNNKFSKIWKHPLSTRHTDKWGKVLQCVYADLPDGCGQTPHCSGCAIRIALDEIKTTNHDILNQNAFHYIRDGDNLKKILIRFSIKKVNEIVYLQIDQE